MYSVPDLLIESTVHFSFSWTRPLFFLVWTVLSEYTRKWKIWLGLQGLSVKDQFFDLNKTIPIQFTLKEDKPSTPVYVYVYPHTLYYLLRYH